jgi:hypothetical protein
MITSDANLIELDPNIIVVGSHQRVEFLQPSICTGYFQGDLDFTRATNGKPHFHGRNGRSMNRRQ